MKYKKESSQLVNEKIRAPRLQLITHDGKNIGEIERKDALRLAESENLDLVMIAEKGNLGLPVCKIMDFGKALYEKKKKQAEAKKHQKIIQVKEIKLRPKIGEHDYQTKVKHAIQFLNEGKRVKITLFFRGRENVSKQERGTELFARVDESFEEAGLTHSLIREKDSRVGQTWSRIYYLKQ